MQQFRYTPITPFILGGAALFRFLVPVGLGQPYLMIDFGVYRQGALDLLMHGTPYIDGHNLPFTYPTFAAILFIPFTWLPAQAGQWIFTIGSILAYAVSTWCIGRCLGTPAVERLNWLLLGLLLAPESRGLLLGQVGNFLMLLVVVDVLVIPARWRGYLLGVAAGIKLTPALFLLLPLLHRDRRWLTQSVLGAMGTVVMSWLVAPGPTWQFFTTLMWSPQRVGGIDYPDNVSILGVLTRISGHAPSLALMTPIVVVTAVVTCLSSRERLQRDDLVGAMLAVAVGTCLISPVTWSHHWVWLAAVLVWLSTRGRRILPAYLVLATILEPIHLHQAFSCAPVLATAGPALLTFGAALLLAESWRPYSN